MQQDNNPLYDETSKEAHTFQWKTDRHPQTQKM